MTLPISAVNRRWPRIPSRFVALAFMVLVWQALAMNPALAQETATPAAVEAVSEHAAPEAAGAAGAAAGQVSDATGDHAGDAAMQDAEHADAGDDHAGDEEHDAHGPLPPVWLVLPFMAILLMIATGPLFYAHHWHHHYPKYSVGLGLIVAVYYIFVLGSSLPVEHAIAEYLSFIALVASLFIAASGIFVSINAKGTPVTNVLLLAGASVIANLIATTGSAMLFIRAYMRLNTGRLKPYHIIFFIFLVANVGGAMTPIGDPPLFLGFLRGVPFFWTMAHIWHIWIFATVLILAIFFVIDSRNKDESPDPDPNKKTIELEGTKSFVWVAAIIALVFVDPNVFDWVPNLHDLYGVPFGIREILMFAVAFAAFKTADPGAMKKNEFTFEPIREVGWLFLGIFATMQPALQLISNFAQQNAETLTVGTFYWGTGMLSAILDNAPTYLNFLAAAMGKVGMDVNDPAAVLEFANGVASGASSTTMYLGAISVAAVFFGAMSYIGNAPNFMVKAIAEANGVETPSFMAYIIRYSLPILLPVYLIVYIVFYSGWVL